MRTKFPGYPVRITNPDDIVWPDDGGGSGGGDEGGGGSGGNNGNITDDVVFIDYDGTIVKTYTKEEFLALEALPPNPSHERLTAQGWNYSIEDAKSYVTNYGRLIIGQEYTTTSGRTEIDVVLDEQTLSFGIKYSGNDDLQGIIYWGDGTSSNLTTASGVKGHTYAAPGAYTIEISVSGTLSIGGNASPGSTLFVLENDNNPNSNRRIGYLNKIQAIRLAANVDISAYAFCNCYSLTSIVLSKGITSIGMSAFSECYSLISVTIPKSVTTIDSYAFSSCHSLMTVALSKGITSIKSQLFWGCSSLTSITIPESVTSGGSLVFQDCCSLTSIIIPEGIALIGSSDFNGCSSLASIILPESITTINDYAFYNCCSLTSIIIPKKVSSIYASAFFNCSSLQKIVFKRTNPPYVSNPNVWSNVLAPCTIYVPAGTLKAYKAASNYPNPSTFTYVELPE